MEVIEQLYKGFVKSKGKKPLDKLKSDTYRTLDEVLQFDSFGGILNDDIILVDIDDAEQSEMLMNIVEDMQLNCYVYITNRGRHFLFKNSSITKNKTHVKLACGLTADIKVGSTTVCHALKVDGTERFLEWDCDYKDLSEIPKFLYPIKSTIDLLSLTEGDGRNEALYRYILDLTRYNLSKEDAKETLSIVNNYIFKDSLPIRELDTIMRDEAFPEQAFYDGQHFKHDEFANFIISNHHVKRINGVLHYYEDGVYVQGNKKIESKMIQYLPKLKSQQRSEVMKYIDMVCVDDVYDSGVNYIAFNNGIYDINTNKLLDFTPNLILTNKIPHDYNPASYDELVDHTLDKLSCGDASIRSLLEEAIGYSFYRRNELSKSFIFLGDKANGKSTFLAMLEECLGSSNYSALDIDELDGRFDTSMMAGKLANIGDDISDSYLRDKTVSMFKKIVSGNMIKAEFKGQDTFSFKPFVKLFFSANNLARMKDPTGAVLRRLVIIPMNGVFTKEDPDYDPYIISKLTTESAMQYLIQLGIQGLKRVLDNHAFTSSKAVDEQVQLYEEENNPIIGFVNEFGEDYLLRETVTTIYRAYQVYCEESGCKYESRINFSKKICKLYNITTKTKKIDGKVYRMFCK